MYIDKHVYFKANKETIDVTVWLGFHIIIKARKVIIIDKDQADTVYNRTVRI